MELLFYLKILSKFQVKDDTYYMEAADMLATCMEERCCTIPMAPTTPVTCSITTDQFGEDMSTYTYT